MFLPLAIPPGVWANGTEYESKGRYRSASFGRWFEGSLRPVGPWRAKTASTVSGKARAIVTWRTNSNITYAAIGTHTHLYAMNRAGTVYDITPAGFTSGRADAVSGGGYGTGNYGAGSYGVPTPDTTTIQPASVWLLDNWGEDLVGCMSEDGIIYEWDLDTGTAAAKVTNSPTANAILVTEEEFLMAYNERLISWSDQAANTVWTPGATVQAGSFTLQTSGTIQHARRVPSAHLVFTDTDVWRGTYQGPPLVYGFERIGSDCGAVSRACSAMGGGVCYWMGLDSFWAYNGYVQRLPSEIADYVFSDFNRDQASKVQAFHNGQFGEVWWFYPSSASVEVDRYAFYNYHEKHWNSGTLQRLCAADRGVMQYPLMVDSSGAIWEHEVSFMAGTYASAEVSATTGPIELPPQFGAGDRSFMVRQYIPDEKTAGDVTVTFYAKQYPNGTETVWGPYSAASPKALRFTARQVKVKFAGTSVDDWRVGTARLDVTPLGYR